LSAIVTHPLLLRIDYIIGVLAAISGHTLPM
jgi:hypothetical protein